MKLGTTFRKFGRKLETTVRGLFKLERYSVLIGSSSYANVGAERCRTHGGINEVKSCLNRKKFDFHVGV